jgi:hypothetical protein
MEETRIIEREGHPLWLQVNKIRDIANEIFESQTDGSVGATFLLGELIGELMKCLADSLGVLLVTHIKPEQREEVVKSTLKFMENLLILKMESVEGGVSKNGDRGVA